MARQLYFVYPPASVEQTVPSSSHSSGSLGPLFVVLAIIIILGVIAGVLARLCGGRHLSGHVEYDFEGWVEHRCASCIDGSLPAGSGGSGEGAAAKPGEGGKKGGGGAKGGGKVAEKKGGGKKKGQKKGGDAAETGGESAAAS